MSFQAYADTRIPAFNRYLEDSLREFESNASQRFQPLIEAMRYSLESGGKRLRPLILLASAETLGLACEDVFPAAAALEYIHTYSLIHDDLPALDDDDTRRGKPSSHKKFGEAVAILAGDALLTEAFGQMVQLMRRGKFQAPQVVSAIELLVQHSGIRGMVGGQLLDVSTAPHTYSLPEVEFIHIHKTGAMILLSVLLPTKLTHIEEGRAQKMRRFGETLGLAFQISDDILDTEPSSRYSRGPRKKPKPSYAQIMSPAEMREKLNNLVDAAVQAITPIGEKARPLIDIAEFVKTRKS